MLTRAPRIRGEKSTSSHQRRIWPWAAGSIIVPLLVILTTLIGARVMDRTRLDQEVTSTRFTTPLDVKMVIQPSAGVALWALTTNAQGAPVIAALGGQGLSSCAPITPCDAPNPATHLLVYDATTGVQILSHPIAATDVRECASPDGSPAGTFYAICGGNLQAFSLTDGSVMTQYALPKGVNDASAALDPTHNALYLIGGDASHPDLISDDLTTGAFIAMQGITGGGVISNPIVDAANGHVLVVENSGGTLPTLAAFDARTLRPLGAVTLDQGVVVGSLDPASDLLFVQWVNSSVGAIDLHQTTFSANEPYPAAATNQLSPQTGATAMGFDKVTQTLVTITTQTVTAYNTKSLAPYASLPVAGPWNKQRLLPVDSKQGIVYLPDSSGAIVGLSLAAPTTTARDPATAIALARAGLVPLLPAATQTPPFLARKTFPVSATTIAHTFAIKGGPTGWQGPYPGSATVKVVKIGAQPGDYTVAFTVVWDQRFVHTHTWTVELLPDGRVKMVSDIGDAIP